MRVRLIAALLAVGVASAAVAQPPAKPVIGTWEVRYTDDSTMKLTLLEESLTFVTPHGALQIPVRDIKKIEFGTRLADADRRAVDAAIADLSGTDNAKREAAKALLAEIGPKALPALTRAKRRLTGDARAQFSQVVEALTAGLPDQTAIPRDTDILHTDESVIAGRVSLSALRVNTFQFGEQKLKVTDVSVMQFGKLTTGGRAKNVEMIDAMIDANQVVQLALRMVGKTVGVRVTGAITGAVWGSGPYTSDSNLGMAAVHAGVLKVGETGVVRIKFVPSPPAYQGTTANGVTTSNYGSFGSGSYVVVREP